MHNEQKRLLLKKQSYWQARHQLAIQEIKKANYIRSRICREDDRKCVFFTEAPQP